MSIAPLRSGGDYHDYLAHESRMLGQEFVGYWCGAGATALGLEGRVRQEPFNNLMAGLYPHGRQFLVQVQAGRRHQGAWDTVYTVPKTLSIAHALGDVETREAIDDCRLKALSSTLTTFLERGAVFARRGAGGERLEPAKLVAAVVPHQTSRALQPHLHLHCVVFNAGLCEDGSFRTIRSEDLYRSFSAARALFLTELGFLLTENLGYRLRPERTWWEIDGISQEAVKLFSRRAEEIDRTIVVHGAATARAKERASRLTRPELVEDVPIVDLRQGWIETAAQAGILRVQVFGLRNRAEPLPSRTIGDAVNRAIPLATEKITEHESHFGRHYLIRRVAESVCAIGAPIEPLTALVGSYLGDDKHIVPLPAPEGAPQYTTPAIWKNEEKLLRLAADLQHASGPAVRAKAVERIARARPLLDGEQLRALQALTTSPLAVQCLAGLPGTGKTRVLEAAVAAWAKAGFTVVGTAVSGRAVRELCDVTGVPGMTLARLTPVLSRSVTDQVKHHGRQLGRAALKKKTWPIEKLGRGKTVILVDEAGTVATRQMTHLLRAAKRAGAKLVLVGDERQLPPVEAGSPFAYLQKLFKPVELVDIKRQGSAWMRRAIRQFAEGDSMSALSQYAAAGCLHVSETPESSMRELIRDWMQHRPPALEEALIIVGTNEEAQYMNDLAQAARIEAGEVSTKRSVKHGDARFCVKDRLLFTKNVHSAGIYNGDFATVEAVTPAGFLRGPGSLTVRLVRMHKHLGRLRPIRATLWLTDEAGVSLGYASTVHKAQARTVERAFILLGGWLQNRETSLVQFSRASHMTRAYADTITAGEDLSELVWQMARSRRKQLAHELVERQELSEQLNQKVSI